MGGTHVRAPVGENDTAEKEAFDRRTVHEVQLEKSTRII